MERLSFLITCLSLGMWPIVVRAEPIPAPDGTGTMVQSQGNLFEITGGTRSGNGQNLFHSFEKFGLDANQTANFVAAPEITNILGRVTGGDGSYIDGLVTVSNGNANLFLINPAGILTGVNARIELSGSFTATTADQLGFQEGWLKVLTGNDYSNLNGNPDRFSFTAASPGSILNQGQISVGQGEAIRLLGGTVFNTGQLTAPEGEITLLAIAGPQRATLGNGGVISLGSNAVGEALLTIPTLPELLQQQGVAQATGLTVGAEGRVRLAGQSLPTEAGVAISSGQMNTGGAVGGTVSILGERVGLLNAQVNASGQKGGGTVQVGGDYQGQGAVPSAQQTFVDSQSRIQADGLMTGHGGRVVVWADEQTVFNGSITAQGGAQSGDGGLVEVSGKQSLMFDGTVDTTAPLGLAGTLLLDPARVVIQSVDFGTTAADDAELDDDNQILVTDRPGETLVISSAKLSNLLRAGNVAIAADESIAVNTFLNNTFGDTDPFALSLSAPLIETIETTDDFPGGSVNLRGDLTLAANRLEGGKFRSEQNLTVTSQASFGNQLTLSDSATQPLVLEAGNSITLQAQNSLNINALVNPASVIRSEGNLSLISDGEIQGNGRFSSGGDFLVTRLDGSSGNLIYTPQSNSGIVSAAGNVKFGDYSGPSLKIEAGGSIEGNNITITEPITGALGNDSDIAFLNKNAVILRAGLTSTQPINSPPDVKRYRQNLPTAFPTMLLPDGTTEDPASENPGILITGDINASTTVMSAPGDIRVEGRIQSYTVNILSSQGNIEIGDPTTPSNVDAPWLNNSISGCCGDILLSANRDLTVHGPIFSVKSNVNLSTTQGNIVIHSIRAGEINIVAGGLFRATGFLDAEKLNPELSDVPELTDFLNQRLGVTFPDLRYRVDINYLQENTQKIHSIVANGDVNIQFEGGTRDKPFVNQEFEVLFPDSGGPPAPGSELLPSRARVVVVRGGQGAFFLGPGPVPPNRLAELPDVVDPFVTQDAGGNFVAITPETFSVSFDEQGRPIFGGRIYLNEVYEITYPSEQFPANSSGMVGNIAVILESNTSIYNSTQSQAFGEILPPHPDDGDSAETAQRQNTTAVIPLDCLAFAEQDWTIATTPTVPDTTPSNANRGETLNNAALAQRRSRCHDLLNEQQLLQILQDPEPLRGIPELQAESFQKLQRNPSQSDPATRL